MGGRIFALKMSMFLSENVLRLLNLNFLNRNFTRPIHTLSHSVSVTDGVYRAACVKIFKFPLPPFSSGVPKVIIDWQNV